LLLDLHGRKWTPISTQIFIKNFIEWRSTVIEAYGQSCNVYIRNGLLAFLLSDTAWAPLPGNTIVEDAIENLPAVITIVPRPILPQFTPLAPAGRLGQKYKSYETYQRKLRHAETQIDK
jgi:hypothetical protein